MKSKPRQNTPQKSIIALHGFTGDAYDFQPLFERVEARWRFMDLPGHCRDFSPVPSSVEEEWEGFVTRLEWTLQELQTHNDPIQVLAYSMGSRLFVRACLERALRVDHAVLIGFQPGIRDEAARRLRRKDDEVWAQRMRQEGMDAFLQEWMKQPLIHRQKQSSDDARMQRKRRLQPEPLAEALTYFSNGRLEPVDKSLMQIADRITLVCGESDLKFREIQERMKALHPTIETHMISEAGHAPHIEQPIRFAPFLETA